MYGFNFLFVFYLVSGCSFINIGAHKYLCPQVKRDHHPLVCQGGVKCFKDHPRLNLEFTHSCSSQKKVWKLNLGHLPDRLPLQHLGQRFQCWSSARLISPPDHCNHKLIWTFLPKWPRQTQEHCHPPDLCCRPGNKATIFRVKSCWEGLRNREWEAPGGRRQDLLTHSVLIEKTPNIYTDEMLD